MPKGYDNFPDRPDDAYLDGPGYFTDAGAIDYAGISEPHSESNPYDGTITESNETDDPVIAPFVDSMRMQPISIEHRHEDSDAYGGVMVKVTEMQVANADGRGPAYQVSELTIRRPDGFSWYGCIEAQAMRAALEEAEGTVVDKDWDFQNILYARRGILADDSTLRYRADRILERVEDREYPDPDSPDEFPGWRPSLLHRLITDVTTPKEAYDAAKDVLAAERRHEHLEQLMTKISDDEQQGDVTEIGFNGTDAQTVYEAIQYGYKLLSRTGGAHYGWVDDKAYEQNLDILSRRIRRAE